MASGSREHESGASSGDLDETASSSELSPAERKKWLAFVKRVTAKLRRNQLERLHASREALLDKLRDIPDRMQRLTNQVRLLIELADDYWAGRYRQVRWYSFAIAVAAALYFLSPSDLIPDTLPGVGHIDDVLVIALALRMVRKDLIAYAKFRNLDPAEYT